MSARRDQARRLLAQVPGLHALARLVVETTRVCMRYRVTGLAAEAAFFTLMSLPPFVLGLFGGAAYVGGWLGQDTVDVMVDALKTYAAQFLTTASISDLLLPTVQEVLHRGRPDLMSLGFLLALWSGSRAVNVFVDTISIMYGQSGVRGIIRTRILSFLLYVGAVLVGIIALPLVLIGPNYLERILPTRLEALAGLYWPAVVLFTVVPLMTLFHIATPRRHAWIRGLPGAALTLVIWALASLVVRGIIAESVGGSSIFGPLSAPIVVMIWLYALAIAVLIGAACNAAVMTLWPKRGEAGMRARARRAAHGIREQYLPPRGHAGTGPVGGTDGFGDGSDDRLVSVRTRSG